MRSSVHTRKAMITMVIVIAFVAIVVPTCRMVGCSMVVGSTMPWGHQPGLGLFGACGGEYVANSTPNAIVPAGSDALTLAIVTAVVAALALFSPRVAVRPIRIYDAAPPPPPEDPRGERLRL